MTHDAGIGKDRCERCVYYHLDEGLCQRYPPVLIVIKDEIKLVYPRVNPRLWCGEYKRYTP